MLKIWVGILSLLTTTAYANRGNIARADLSLTNLLLSRKSIFSSSAPMECFRVYLPMSENVTNQWALDYNLCLQIADAERNHVMELARQQQQNLATEASDVCSQVQNCQAINETMPGLECLSTLSSNTLSTMYVVSNNASDIMADVHHDISIIQADMYKCTNTSERVYTERWAQIYNALDDCLQNGMPATMTPPPPTTASALAVVDDAAYDTPNMALGRQLIVAPNRSFN